MPRKPRDIEDLLQGKFGFSKARSRSPDHRWCELELPGLPKIATMVSHNKSDVGANLEAKMARQLRVKKPYFDAMMGCSRSREDYYAQVRESPYPPFEIGF